MLTDDEVDAAAENLDGWQRSEGALRRAIRFPSFLAGIEAVRRVAERAEANATIIPISTSAGER